MFSMLLEGGETYWRGRLPHWHKPGCELFITLRCAGSLPESVLGRFREITDTLREIEPNSEAFLAQQRLYFASLEKYLDAGVGFCPFREKAVAELLAEEMERSSEIGWHFLAWAIMPNHLHVLVKTEEGAMSMAAFWKTFKGRTAREANQLLSRSGSFWQKEWFDRWLRDGEREKVLCYIANNPVKANLSEMWRKYPYVKMPNSG